jgi:hypothetical protein
MKGHEKQNTTTRRITFSWYSFNFCAAINTVAKYTFFPTQLIPPKFKLKYNLASRIRENVNMSFARCSFHSLRMNSL